MINVNDMLVWTNDTKKDTISTILHNISEIHIKVVTFGTQSPPSSNAKWKKKVPPSDN